MNSAGANCPACQEFFRRKQINRVRLRCKLKGVPKEQWPEISTKRCGSNKKCVACLNRMAYFRNRMRKMKGFGRVPHLSVSGDCDGKADP